MCSPKALSIILSFLIYFINIFDSGDRILFDGEGGSAVVVTGFFLTKGWNSVSCTFEQFNLLKLELLLTFSIAFLSEVDPCSMTPCSNGGSCLNLPEGNYKCTCKSGWTGKQCEVCKYIFWLTLAALPSYFA